MILIHDSKLFENNQMLLSDINNKTKIIEIKEKAAEKPLLFISLNNIISYLTGW